MQGTGFKMWDGAMADGGHHFSRARGGRASQAGGCSGTFDYRECRRDFCGWFPAGYRQLAATGTGEGWLKPPVLFAAYFHFIGIGDLKKHPVILTRSQLIIYPGHGNIQEARSADAIFADADSDALPIPPTHVRVGHRFTR